MGNGSRCCITIKKWQLYVPSFGWILHSFALKYELLWKTTILGATEVFANCQTLIIWHGIARNVLVWFFILLCWEFPSRWIRSRCWCLGWCRQSLEFYFARSSVMGLCRTTYSGRSLHHCSWPGLTATIYCIHVRGRRAGSNCFLSTKNWRNAETRTHPSSTLSPAVILAQRPEPKRHEHHENIVTTSNYMSGWRRFFVLSNEQCI